MDIKPPIAKKNPTNLEKHGDIRVDNYYWMNNREDQEVIDYLNAENSYYAAMTAPTKEFQDELFTEMKSRIKEDDSSVPYKLMDIGTYLDMNREWSTPYMREKRKVWRPKRRLCSIATKWQKSMNISN